MATEGIATGLGLSVATVGRAATWASLATQRALDRLRMNSGAHVNHWKEFSIRSGFRELKNTDFKPKGPARILVRAIAADPTRTRSLNSPLQALHTRIVVRDAEARPGRPRLSSPNRGQWDMELVEGIGPAA